MFSGHNALNMPLHSQTNHKTSGDRQAWAVLSYLTFQQDINFLKSKSDPHCKTRVVFVVSNGGRLCLLQSESGDHCYPGAQVQRMKGNAVTAPGHCTGAAPTPIHQSEPSIWCSRPIRGRGWPPISSSLSSDNGALCHTLDIGQSLIITRPSSDIR